MPASPFRPLRRLRRRMARAALGLALVALAAAAGGAGGGLPPSLRSLADGVTGMLGREEPARVARITHVRDGDTVETRAAVWRLLGIDAPESARPGVAVECGSLEAKDALLRMVFRRPPDRDGDGLADGDGRRGARVRFTTDASQDRVDRYGRRLGYAAVAGARRTLQERLLAAGWAKVYVYRGRRLARFRAFVRAARTAKHRRRGVYALCGGDFHRPR
jgi:micrococcal nuclease